MDAQPALRSRIRETTDLTGHTLFRNPGFLSVLPAAAQNQQTRESPKAVPARTQADAILPGLVTIFFKAVQAGRGRSPVLVAQNGLPPMRQGLVAILQSKIAARPCARD
jgi:hypothetical protein